MTDEEFRELFERNRVRIAASLLLTPRIFGDPKRLKYNSYCAMNDLLINTMSGTIEVGKDCFFGHGCMLLTGTHDHTKFGLERANGYPTEGRDIVLEEGVWLASSVIVLGPARIGKHSVISAGSVVRGDLPAYGVYSGSPAVKVADIPPPA